MLRSRHGTLHVIVLLALLAVPGCASTQTPATPLPQPTKAERQTRDGFQMELRQCVRTPTESIECSFTVTNLRADVDWGIDADSRLVTVTGSVHSVSVLRLGNKQARNWDVGLLMVKDIPTPLVAEFEEVEPSTARIGLIEIRDGTERTVFQFRNVPISVSP